MVIKKGILNNPTFHFQAATVKHKNYFHVYSHFISEDDEGVREHIEERKYPVSDLDPLTCPKFVRGYKKLHKHKEVKNERNLRG